MAVLHAPVNTALEVINILRVLTHTLARYVGQLSNILPVALGCLHDNVQRGDASVVGQVGADAERNLASILEVPVNLIGLLEIQAVAEEQRLLCGINAQLTVVTKHLFSPLDGISRVMPDTRKQGGVGELEVPQETVSRDGVGQRRAIQHPVLLYPCV